MKLEITILLIFLGLFCVGGFYAYVKHMQKSFENTPTDVVESQSVWRAQQEKTQDMEMKRKQMMENLREQMQHQGY